MSAAPNTMPRPIAPRPNVAAIPRELAQLTQWVLWRYEQKGDKWTKVPKRPSGGNASSTDPASWTTLANAQRVYETKPGAFDGIGFVTADTDTTVLGDLDHVLDPESGEVVPWARAILDAAEREDAYVERSPSGTGFHIIGHGEQGFKGVKRNDAELYCRERFFTITGQGVTREPGTPLGHLVETVALLRDRLSKEAAATPGRGRAASTVSAHPSIDDELLERARRARNGAKFAWLFDAGDSSEYDSASEADLALASILAFWTGRDPTAIERLMRRSALARDKWHTPRGDSTYLADTIAKAIAETRETYGSGTRANGPASPVAAPVDRPAQITDTDLANARRFAVLFGDDARFTAARGWFVWDGRRWAHDEKSVAVIALCKRTALSIFDEIRNAADQAAAFRHARRSQSKNSIAAMEYLARSEPGIAVPLTRFDADPWLLNVANGTLDLRTGALRPHTKSDLCSKMTEVAFDPDADCPRWLAFLNQVLDREDVVAYIQRAVGYFLTGRTSEQVLHFFFGLGANGKSVFCEVLELLLGDYALVAAPELIMARRHQGIPNDVARLRGARLVTMNETSQGARFDEAKLKDLTGGDTLTGRFLHAEYFDFQPTHKLLIRGNHKPAITGTDEGIWRRLRLIPFTVQIPPGQQDHALLDKLRAELPGILRWAVDGCLEWQRDGLNPPPSVAEAVALYREEADVLGRFIEERCIVRNLAQVKSSALYQAYQRYCEDAGERWIPSRDLPQEMQRRGFQHRRGHGGKRLYHGIELQDDGGGRWSGDGR